MSGDPEKSELKGGTIVAVCTSLGVTAGAVVGATMGDVGFWVAMGICFGAAMGSCIIWFFSKKTSGEE